MQVECVTGERLGVNVTWKLHLEDVPPASLPDLHDIGTLCSFSEALFLHLSGGAGDAL